jgi:hypothetical protein
VSGDGRGVVLVGSDGTRRDPGGVPAGSYAIEADFGSGPVPAGTVDVAAGATVDVVCRGMYARCVQK